MEVIMAVKALGILILVIGLLFSIYTGLGFETKEKVVDLGSVEITKDTEHNVNWSPLWGVGAMIIGGVLFVVGSKKKVV
jgi:drug/metabolite transporter (DMT)-like permease